MTRKEIAEKYWGQAVEWGGRRSDHISCMESAMKDYALHLAEKAVYKEAENQPSAEGKRVYRYYGCVIAQRIKTLTEE